LYLKVLLENNTEGFSMEGRVMLNELMEGFEDKKWIEVS
jgi:hypothetical protein